jgi:hypothetical protein
MRHKVTYEIKDARKRLIIKERVFDNSASACSFFREIRSTSVSKPVIDIIITKDKEID